MENIPKAVGEALKNIVPKSVENVAENLTGEISKNIGNTISDIWFLVFGGITQRATLRRIEYQVAADKFKEACISKANAIPEEDRLEPKTQMIINTLHDAESCVEEDELREMFANLIASSMNAKTVSYVHPSFSSILRQCSPLDAALLKHFSSMRTHPIANYQYYDTPASYKTIFRNILFFPDENVHHNTQRSSSLEFLAKQGLIDLDYPKYLVGISLYEKYIEFLKVICDQTLTPYYNDSTIMTECPCVTFERGAAILTDFGSNFIKVCMG